MKLTFNGAAGMVTGSCYLLEAANERILVDCGMFQGPKEITRLNYEPFRFDPKKISCLLLTHAHIDHSGLIPKLVRNGFRGKIIATAPTVDLSRIMLEDSANVNRWDTEYENKRRLRMGLAPRKPLYELADVKMAMKLFSKVEYGTPCKVADSIGATFHPAGHILGASIIELNVKEGGKEKKIVFSGDLGQWDNPLVGSPTVIESADYVLVESTYGNRPHESTRMSERLFAKEVMGTFGRGGILMIPSFAVERAQELLYYLHRMERDKVLPGEMVFLDSPLAIAATRVFNEHAGQFVPGIQKEFREPFAFRKLKFLESAEESMAINGYKKPCIIIAGSGMCTAGRIRHHLKHHLWNPKNTLLFVGYQAEGTLGRVILEGAKSVRMMGIEVAVKARVRKIDSFSSHADATGLVEWVRGFKVKPEKVFIVHGETDSALGLETELNKLGFDTHVAKLGESVEL
ncbi:MBL fold metallo-hydrolase [Candidatus Micrarchaeota archaeon]|nr:MBL fold metallo-hydrolase [Candidatus Micrarchaeota archaeon]